MKSNGAKCNGVAAPTRRIDDLIAGNRDLLQCQDGDRLADEARARLLRPWCAALPQCVSRRLPLTLKLWASAKRWAWRLMLVYLIYTAAYAAITFYFEKQLDDWYKSDTYTDMSLTANFFIRRLAVWLALPMTNVIHGYAGGSCILENPLYRRPISCCNCKFNLTLSKVTDVEKVMENFNKLVTTGKPRSFLIVNHEQEPVSFARVRQTALENEADMNIGYTQLTTLSGPRVSGLPQLFSDESRPPPDSAVLWRISHVEGLRHFRALVHRPEFVSRELEINLARQFLFFGSDHTERVALGLLSEIDGQVYIVGLAGEIVFTVKSNPECCRKADKRVSRTAVVRPGRLLSLPAGCYEVAARRNGTEYGMAYMGSVAMAQSPATERGKEKKK